MWFAGDVAAAAAAVLAWTCWALVPGARGQLSDSPNALRNWCLDSTFHKPKPGPEPQLFGEVRVICNSTPNGL